MTKTAALRVFYDGKCPLCQREIAYYQRLTSTEPINWIDANENPNQLKAAGITKAEALARLHAVSTKGEILSVTFLAKIKTFAQMMAIICLIPSVFIGYDYNLQFYGLALLWVSTLLSLFTAYQYVKASLIDN